MANRRFSVITLKMGEIILLPSEDVSRMQNEFPKAFNRIYNEARNSLKSVIAHYITTCKRKENDPEKFAKEQSLIMN
jgi:hypothetical protein